MRKIFDFEGPVATFLGKFADLLWLNIIYIVCCLPIITIGAATTALYYVTLKMDRDEESYITKQFFKSFISNFKQATCIWLIYVIIIVILATDVFITSGMGLSGALNSQGPRSVILVASGLMIVLVVMTLLYVFPLLAKFDNTIKNTIRNSFLISIRHLPYTIAMLAITVAPFIVIGMIPRASIILFITFSVIAYTNSRFFNKIFDRYVPKEDIVEETENTVANSDNIIEG